jgi:hypothetical protein
MLVNWDGVKAVLLDVRKITVVTEIGRQAFKFNSNIEAQIAFDDWLSMPNARRELCQGALEIRCSQ